MLAGKGQAESKRSFCTTGRQTRNKTDGVKGETGDKRKNPQITDLMHLGFVLECMTSFISGRAGLCRSLWVCLLGKRVMCSTQAAPQITGLFDLLRF